MKKQLHKKLYGFIATAMLFSVSANAQIVYTDVIPDSTLYDAGRFSPTKNYDLDLNNDANSDFIITAYQFSDLSGGTSKAYATPLNGNAVKDTLVNSVNVSIPLQFNAAINSNLLLRQSWQASGLNIMKQEVYFNPSSGLWDNLSDYYLGLRLLQSGQTYYGWVRLRVDVTLGHASVIIRDYAYNSVPNQPILAGQTIATGINENPFSSSINLFPNPANNHLTIALGSNNKNVEVAIADITGKIVYTTTIVETDKVEVNTSEFAEGIYIVQIQSGEFISTKKLIVKK